MVENESKSNLIIYNKMKIIVKYSRHFCTIMKKESSILSI